MPSFALEAGWVSAVTSELVLPAREEEEEEEGKIEASEIPFLGFLYFTIM